MKKIIICFFIFLNFSVQAEDPERSCSFNGIPLYGKVKVLDHGADINVKVVESRADLRVKSVNSSPNSCGKWQFVNSSYDFTIKYVFSNPDIRIKYVSSRPGLPLL